MLSTLHLNKFLQPACCQMRTKYSLTTWIPRCLKHKQLSLSIQPRHFQTTSLNETREKLQQTILEAGKTLGKSHSHFNPPMASLELQNFLMITKEMRETVDISNPILQNLKRLIYTEQTNAIVREMTVLLLGGIIDEMRKTVCKDINAKLTCLASATKLIYCSHKMRDVLEEVTNDAPDGETLDAIKYGNKTVVLLGDYLLSNAYALIAEICSPQVFGNMSLAICESVMGEFTFIADTHKRAFPSKDSTFCNWETKTLYSTSSLFANSCKSTALVAQLDDDYQKRAYEFGKLMGLAWQVSTDLCDFGDDCDTGRPFSLVSCPVILHLQHDKKFFELLVELELENVDYRKIRAAIQNGPAIQIAKTTNNNYVTQALIFLENFPPSPHKTALENLVTALQI